MIFAQDMPNIDHPPAIVEKAQKRDIRKAKQHIPSKKSKQMPFDNSQGGARNTHFKQNITGPSADLVSIVQKGYNRGKRESRHQESFSSHKKPAPYNYKISSKSPEFTKLAKRLDLKRKHTVDKMELGPDHVVTYTQRGKQIENRPLKKRELSIGSVINSILNAITPPAHAAPIESYGAKIRWDFNTDPVNGYRAYWFAGNDMPLTKDVPSTDNFTDITGLDPSKTYTVFLRAFRNTIWGLKLSGDSNYVSATSSYMFPIFRPPEYTIDFFDSTIRSNLYTFTGTIEEDSTMEIDGMPANVDEAGTWSLEMELPEGEHTLEFVASNDEEATAEYRDITVDLPPVISDFYANTNPFGDGLDLSFNISDTSLDIGNVYVNGNHFAALTQAGEFDLSDVPLEFLVNGENNFEIEAIDSVGNTTLVTETLNLLLGYVAFEAGELHNNDSVPQDWRKGGWGGISRQAELSTDESMVTEGSQAIKLPFDYVPENRCVTWTKTLSEFYSLDDFERIEYDTFNPRGGQDIASKLEFYVEDGGYYAIKEPFTEHGIQHHVLQVADMLPSGSPISRNIEDLRIAGYNRSDDPINAEEGLDYFGVDRLLGILKLIYDDFDSYSSSIEVRN